MIAKIVTISQAGGFWRWSRSDGRGLTATSTTRYPTALDAAMVAAEIARCNDVPVRVPDYVRDQMIMEWRLNGADLYREGLDDTLCQNQYERQGYAAAQAEDTQPLGVFGWPGADDDDDYVPFQFGSWAEMEEALGPSMDEERIGE